MSSYLKSIMFAVVVTLICGSLLTLASTGLKEYQLKNIAIDKQKNILKSVGLVHEKTPLSPGAIDKLYAENIKQVWVDPSGDIIPEQNKTQDDLPVYLYVIQNHIQSYIIPVDSRGLWGKILGYLAIENDGATISGFTVYSHSETPGLGGEIEKDWFQKNFSGKKILDDRGNFVSVAIAKGLVKDKIHDTRQKNFVDGISGATLTGKFLSAGLKQSLMQYEPFSQKLRNDQIQ
jgi:Na+-transporting NADH:ubiquinone oxidoreductase subunit C